MISHENNTLTCTTIKTALLCISIFLLTSTVAAQSSDVFVVVEERPELIGGMAALQDATEYPEFAKKAGIEGRVVVQFVVDEQGNVQNPTVTRGVHKLLDQAAVEAVKEMKFQPGKQDGQAVKVQMSLPVTFRMRGEDLGNALEQLSSLGIGYSVDSFINQARRGNSKAVELFLASGMKPDVTSDGESPNIDDGESPLMAAARAGNAKVVELLLNAGANVNRRNQEGETALLAATQRGCAEATRALLNGGANPNTTLPGEAGDAGATVLLAIGGERAVNCGEYPETVQALLNGGAAPSGWGEQPVDGWTPLMRASFAGQVEAARILLEAGANPNVQLEDGRTALLMASASGHPSIVRTLLDAGADPNAEAHGYTPLKIASEKGYREIVRILRQAGAHDPSQQDNDGSSDDRPSEDGPSETVVRAAVEEFINSPFENITNLRVFCKDGKVSTLSVLKRGPVRQQGEFYAQSMRVKVTGTCQVMNLTGGDRTVDFESTAEIDVYQNGLGEWEATAMY